MSSLAARCIDYVARNLASRDAGYIVCTLDTGQTEKRTGVYSNAATLTQPSERAADRCYTRKTAMTDLRAPAVIIQRYVCVTQNDSWRCDLKNNDVLRQ